MNGDGRTGKGGAAALNGKCDTLYDAGRACALISLALLLDAVTSNERSSCTKERIVAIELAPFDRLAPFIYFCFVL